MVRGQLVRSKFGARKNQLHKRTNETGRRVSLNYRSPELESRRNARNDIRNGIFSQHSLLEFFPYLLCFTQTVKQYRDELNARLLRNGHDVNVRFPDGYQEAPLAYDAVWAVALGTFEKLLHSFNSKICN